MVEAFVLRVQGLVDRCSRWMRLIPAAGTTPGRRFLIIQIDGLSRAVFDGVVGGDRRGAGDSLRNLRRLLATRRLERRDLSVGLPSSTPAFQAAIMYGVRPDIPGFHFFDKREGLELHFPRRGVADLVEQRHADGRPGILEGGACYGCVFTGGAQDSLWTFARLGRLSQAGSVLGRTARSAVLLSWVALKCLGLTLVTLVRFVGRVAAALPMGRAEVRRAVEALALDIGVSIWARQLFTLLVSADLYRGVTSIYVNFIDYDIAAHAFGPADRLAFRALRGVDRSIQQLARIVRRLPELGYDLYVLSDHGQVLTRSFESLSGGTPVDQVIRATLDGVREDRLKIITAGPNAFVYFTDRAEPLGAAQIEARHPRALESLSRHPGIGLVLARGAAGPVAWHRGHRLPLTRSPEALALDPFAQRPDRDVVLAGLRDLMAMPSAGDIVLYGIGAAGGDVSFIDERGAHAGPSEAELQTFILHPPSVCMPATPLTHPVQLYPHFMSYHAAEARRARVGGLSTLLTE